MQDPQTATSFFLGPIAVAYLFACAGWMAYDRMAHLAASEPQDTPSERPSLDLLLMLAAGAGILGLGSVYRHGWLLPTGDTWMGRAGWMLDNLVIYSPIAGVLALRRQGPGTLFLSRTRLAEKIAVGLVLGVASLALYSVLRGEASQIGPRLARAIEPDALVDFLPVFLEGVALAFAFVRFRWLVGTIPAVVVPVLVFAAAHVPSQLANDRTLVHMAIFFAFNSVLSGVILMTVARSRDIVWIGLVHYLLDVAIEAV